MKTKLLKKIRKYYTVKYTWENIGQIKVRKIYLINHHLKEVVLSTDSIRTLMYNLSERFGLGFTYMDKINKRDSINYYKFVSKL